MPATQSAASPNFEKLKAKLRELFELDKADLDFGIYRILRQRHREITEFLDKRLEKTVREALQSHATLQRGHVEQELEQAEKAATAAGIAPEQSPRVMELRARLAGDFDLEATADEVYSHLYTFFSRYYQDGDFLGLHRSTVRGREKYMIPYNGEEVKLVWANMDQYYIKSSELLRDYRFKVSLGDAEGAELKLEWNFDATVEFKLIEGDTEKDNRKPDGKTTRAFCLDEEKPFEISRGDAENAEGEENVLTIRFRYREHPSERNLQDKLNADTLKTLADKLPPKWKTLLFQTSAPSASSREVKELPSILQKHLRAYTARHQFDYFIHKDLGGFLRRELDFYIKNEVMRLDDIEQATAPKAEEYLSKIRAIRRCAEPVIRMLAQLEDFQRKLWLKKKFVVETRYCLTIDRVPESLYPEIAACDAQWQEWEQLYAISEIAPGILSPDDAKAATKTNTASPAPIRVSASPREDFLRANPHLMLDTRHFSRDFTLRLLASLDNLDDSLDGVCFHSENFQALQLMQERYREQVDCIYIDPPYNTGNDGFAYKDSYQHSSWAAALFDRLQSALSLLDAVGGCLFCSIDDGEQSVLREVLQQVFGADNFVANVIWQKKYAPANDALWLSDDHDFLITCARNKLLWSPGRLPRDEKQNKAYANPDNDPRGEWRADNYKCNKTADERPNLYYPITNPFTGKEVWPQKNAVWRYTKEQHEKNVAENRVWWGKDGSNEVPAYKRFLSEVGDVVPRTIWKYEEVGHNQDGIRQLREVFPDTTFTSPKPVGLIERVIRVGNAQTLLDFFAGSGTTGHAVINLNRKEKERRKYILAEMGEYFDTVLVPRLKKVVYSTDWRDGKPQSRDTGISHAFKIVRLESYEDTLNNLRLRRTPEQEAALRNAPEAQRDAYLLGYFLDVESEGSASLLDVAQFRDPFRYKLLIATSSAGETKETAIDLVETFNWLLGLKVKTVDFFAPEAAKDTKTSHHETPSLRAFASSREQTDPAPSREFLRIEGEKRAGGRCLILWRTLSDDPQADNAALEKYLDKLAVNPADTEYDFIYINGPHTLPDPHNKIHLIEETFHRLMFETTNFESLS